jgi:ABC-type Fe3+-hydroxamate transport system substrate-binding protein
MEFIDQMNRTIRLEKTPRRIVSLVPSQTELLYDLGCKDRVVGITKFCIHPDKWFREKTRVGGTKQLNFDRIAELEPDLIIANKEENTKDDIERLALDYPVYISDISNVDDALKMIQAIGQIVNESNRAQVLSNQILNDYQSWPQLDGKVLYFIWANPFMVAGKNTFIGQVLSDLGLENAIDDPNARYPELKELELSQLDLEYVFLSSEPFPFKEKHIKRLEKLTQSKVLLVDSEMFSWYGSRMLKMKSYFETLVNTL